MSVKTIKIRGEIVYEFSYDPDSRRFKKTLADFRKTGDKSATANDLLRNVAHQLYQRGGIGTSMFERIGFISNDGKVTGNPDSGISVTNQDPDVWFFR